MDSIELAHHIDHTVLKVDTTPQDLEKACKEANSYQFATVCVRPQHVAQVKKLLGKGSLVKPISVVGFPTGLDSVDQKVGETRRAIHSGAAEIDMVIHLDALKKRDLAYVFRDISAVVQAARSTDDALPVPVKVIIEASELSHEEKIIACAIAVSAGAAFVKTSTGFAPGGGGATAEDVALMRKTVGPHIGVKASGGIRTREQAVKMIEAGANRIGASSSVAIVTTGATAATDSGY
jgi:deoxyribose-phosphate aldolase